MAIKRISALLSLLVAATVLASCRSFQFPDSDIGEHRSSIESKMGAPLPGASDLFATYQVTSASHAATRTYIFEDLRVRAILDEFGVTGCGVADGIDQSCLSAGLARLFSDVVRSATSQYGAPERQPGCLTDQERLTDVLQTQVNPGIQCLWNLDKISVEVSVFVSDSEGSSTSPGIAFQRTGSVGITLRRSGD